MEGLAHLFRHRHHALHLRMAILIKYTPVTRRDSMIDSRWFKSHRLTAKK
jgi:hypothetical protein